MLFFKCLFYIVSDGYFIKMLVTKICNDFMACFFSDWCPYVELVELSLTDPLGHSPPVVHV